MRPLLASVPVERQRQHLEDLIAERVVRVAVELGDQHGEALGISLRYRFA
jgi:hypothetical protein